MTVQRDKAMPHEQSGREPEPFLSRWSRRKQEARREPPESHPEKTGDREAPPPQLPPLEKLTFESDYRGFLHPKVSEDMRRAALKRLFSDPRFNVMDGLDVYIDDYSKSDPIPAAMLAGLRQAQQILAWAKEDEEKRAREESQQSGAAEKTASAPELPPPADTAPPESASRGADMVSRTREGADPDTKS